MWKFIVDVVHDFVSSLQPDVGRGFLHVSHVFLFFTSERLSTVEIMVKVQFRGPKLFYKEKGKLFQEESYLQLIFKFSFLILNHFILLTNVFWWQIYFRKHGKSTPNDRQDHHVLVVDIVIMMWQCRCTRALSQSHIAKHDNHVPVTPLIGSGTGCHFDAMAGVWQNHIRKNIQITFKLRPSIHNSITNLFAKA